LAQAILWSCILLYLPHPKIIFGEMAAEPQEEKVDVADEGGEDGEAGMPDMASLQAMMGGMGGGGDEGGEGGAGGMDMEALMSMLGKGGGKGGGGGGMADMMGGMGGGGMGGMGGKGGGKGKEEDDSEKAGGDGKWHWTQKGEEVQIRFPLTEPTTKKDITVKFKTKSLSVSVRGETLLDGTTGGKVEVDDCTWCLSPDRTELQVMLTKMDEKDSWNNLLE